MSDLHWFNLSTLTIKKDTIEKQYDYAYKMYIRSINEFFNYAPYKVIFPVESLLDEDNPVLTIIINEEIPAKLMYKFCEEFGYYAPTVTYHEDIMNGLRTYKFIKKVNWDNLKDMIKIW